MKIRALEPMRDWPFVKRLIGCVWCEDTRGLVAERENGELAGAVVFDHWTLNSVQVHQGYETPMALRANLHGEAFRYAFETGGRGLMIGPTPANNARACKLNQHFGFKVLGTIPDAHAPGVDYIIYGMRREECRFLKDSEAA